MHSELAIRVPLEALSPLGVPEKVSLGNEKKELLLSGETKDIYNIALDGEVPNLWKPKHIGLLANCWATGLAFGFSQAIIYPIVNVHFNSQNQVVSAATSVALLFWCYKIFFGLLSDAFPIFGLRRKPYIFIGWTIAIAALAILGYLGDDATSDAYGVTIIVSILGGCNLGYVLADVAGDGLIVSLAHREPIEVRGRAQSLTYIVRGCGYVLGCLLVGLVFNNPKYGGNFGFGLDISSSVWLVLGILTAMMPLYLILEEKPLTGSRRGGADVVALFYDTLQNKAVYQIILWTTVSGFLGTISNNAVSQANNIWVKLTPFQYSLMAMFESLISVVGLWLVRTYFLETSWRTIYSISFIVSSALSLLYLLVVYDIIRTAWFVIFSQVSVYFSQSWSFFVGVFCIVEVSAPGVEAMTYAMITTASNMVVPVSGIVSNQIAGLFDVQPEDLRNEAADPGVRDRFLYLTLLVLVINSLALFTLPLLPRQKKEARELFVAGGKSPLAADVLVGGTFLCLLCGTLFNLLTVIPGISCLKFLGGNGCAS